MEWLPWLSIAIIGGTAMFWFISQPDPNLYTPITVEIVGLAIAFFIAISFSELIKTKDKQERRNELIDSFLVEIKSITRITEPTALMNIDMWAMAITSGELSILEKQIRSDFRKFYVLVGIQRDMRSTWIASIPVKNPELFKGMSSELESLYKSIQGLGIVLLKKYST